MRLRTLGSIWIALLAIAGCKAQQRSSQIDPNASPGAVTQSKAQRVTGWVGLNAPVQDAHVTIKRLSAGAADEFISETKTDEHGQFDITLPQPTNGDLLIVVDGGNGGATVEPVSGTPINLSEDDHLMTVVAGTHVGDETQVMINPVSTLVAARAVAAFRGGAKLSDALSRDTDLFSSHFQTASPWLSTPVDVTAGAAPGISSGVILGLTIVGLSQHALELGARASVTDVSSLLLLRLLVADLADGVFDGKNDGVALKVVGNVFIDQETTRTSLAHSIETWLDSPQNMSGLTKRDVTKLTSAMRGDVSELYPPTDVSPPVELPPTAQSGAPPVITLTTPTDGQTIGKSDPIAGLIESEKGLSAFTLSIDGAQVIAPIDTSSATAWKLSFLPALVTGSHVLEIVATDSQTNQTKKQVQFNYDDQGPAIAFVQCSAPDDRVRAATVTVAGATYANSTTLGACTEPALGDGSQQFYTFADLFDSGSPAPFVTLAVTDNDLGAVTYVVKQNNTVIYGPTGLPTAPTGPATHVISLDQAVLGVPATAIHANDVISIEVTANDNVGNVSARAFKFHMTALPTPLYIQEIPADASVRLDTHSFAADNVGDLFHQAFDINKTRCGSYWCQAFPESLIHVSKYSVINASSRPITLSTDWATAMVGSMSMTRTAFRSVVMTGLNYSLGPSPCPEITEVDDICDYCSGAAPNYATQTCYSLSGDYKKGKNSESLIFTPTVAVYAQPGNVRQTTPTVTMPAGGQFTVVIGMYNLHAPTYPTVLVNTQYPIRDQGGVFGGGGYATSAGFNTCTDGFCEPDDYYSGSSSSEGADGFITKRGLILSYTTMQYTIFRGFIGYRDWYGQTTRAHLIKNGSVNNWFRPVVFEHSINFSSTAKWKAAIAMSASDPMVVGTGNHQPVATLSAYQSQMAQPNLCAYANPLCSVDLSGW